MLRNANVQPMLPVQDIAQAQQFYDQTLGLQRVHEHAGEVLTYKSGNTTFNVYRSQFAGTNKGTAAVWEVDDVEKIAQDLKAKGVVFEHYDNMTGLQRQGDVYRADDFAVAWFKDPAGNILSIQSKPRDLA